MDYDDVGVVPAFLEPEGGADVVPARLGCSECSRRGGEVGVSAVRRTSVVIENVQQVGPTRYNLKI